MQKAGAKAAIGFAKLRRIASLWQVDDSGTQSLMDHFYRALGQGQPKTQALQLAQQTLISGNPHTIGQPQASLTAIKPTTSRRIPENSQLSHPYH